MSYWEWVVYRLKTLHLTAAEPGQFPLPGQCVVFKLNFEYSKI
jgi:hypothetical protein